MKKITLTPEVILEERKQAENSRFPKVTDFKVNLNGHRVVKGTLLMPAPKVTPEKVLTWLQRGQLPANTVKGLGYQLAKDAGVAA